jgi:hypothetical protein
MKAAGIMSIQPRLSLPFEVSLELEGVTPYINPKALSDQGGVNELAIS